MRFNEFALLEETWTGGSGARSFFMACLLLRCPVVVMEDVEPPEMRSRITRWHGAAAQPVSWALGKGAGRLCLPSVTRTEIEPQGDAGPAARKVGRWLSSRNPCVGDF